MTERPIRNVTASVHQRLLNKAAGTGRPFNELLQYYAMERFLYRLCQAPQGSKFVLKGALMFRAWNAPLARPTMDIDLLAQIKNDMEAICGIMRAACAMGVEPDGMTYDAEGLTGGPIAEDAQYDGVRVSFTGYLGNARVRLQIDIGFGDMVVPPPATVELPAILDFPP